MTTPDRRRLLELLAQLGAESDAAVLSAAREASRIVADAGTSWGALVAPEDATAESLAAMEARPAVADGDRSQEARIVERLLSRKEISDTLRDDLEGFRKQIAEGKLEQMDADYIHALAQRLG